MAVAGPSLREVVKEPDEVDVQGLNAAANALTKTWTDWHAAHGSAISKLAGAGVE